MSEMGRKFGHISFMICCSCVRACWARAVLFGEYGNGYSEEREVLVSFRSEWRRWTLNVTLLER